MIKCRQNGRRRLGRPLKSLLDEIETGLLRFNWFRMMMMMMMIMTMTMMMMMMMMMMMVMMMMMMMMMMAY